MPNFYKNPVFRFPQTSRSPSTVNHYVEFFRNKNPFFFRCPPQYVSTKFLSVSLKKITSSRCSVDSFINHAEEQFQFRSRNNLRISIFSNRLREPMMVVVDLKRESVHLEGPKPNLKPTRKPT